MKILIKHVTNIIWWLVVLSVVFLAVVIVLFKQLAPYIDNYRPQIEKNLTQIVGYPVSINRLEASTIGLDPTVIVEGISLTVPTQSSLNEQPIKLKSLTVKLDLLRSLLSLEPNFSLIRFNKPEIELIQKAGVWSIPGISTNSKTNETAGLERLLSYILNQDHMSILDMKLNMTNQSSHHFSLQSRAIYLQRTDQGIGISGQIKHSDLNDVFKFNGEWVGEIDDPESLIFTGAFILPEFNIEPKNWLDTSNISINDINIGADLWVKYIPNESIIVSGQFASKFTESIDQFYQVNSKFKITYNLASKNIRLDLVDLSLKDNDKEYPQTQLTLYSNSANKDLNFELEFDQFDLSLANKLFSPYLNKDWFISNMLGAMQASGTAENAHLRVWQEEITHFEYTSNLSIINEDGYNNIPSAKNLAAILKVTDQDGSIEFSSEDVVFGFPLLYDNLWHVEGISGKVDWQILPNAVVVKGQNLLAKRNGADISGLFHLEIVPNGEDMLLLDFHAKNLSVADRLDYIPNNVLPDSALEWIEQRLLLGTVDNADFVLQMPLAKESSSHILLDLDVSHASIKFADDWPAATGVNANFSLNSQGIEVDVAESQLDNIKPKHVVISLPFAENQLNLLNIEGDFEENTADVLSLLRSTDLAESVLEPFKDWQADGEVNGEFSLSLALSETDNESPKLNLTVDFNDNNLLIESLNLPIEIHSGHLQYASASGINDSLFHVSAFGGDAKVDLFATQNSDAPLQVKADINGNLNPVILAQWLNLPPIIQNSFSGMVSVNGTLDVNKRREGQIDLSLFSDLKDTELAFPAPLNKAKELPKALSMALTVYQDDLIVNTEYEGYRSKVSFNKGAFYGGELFINKSGRFKSVLAQGLSIYGDLATYNYAEWAEWAEASKQTDSQKLTLTIPDWLNKINFIVDTVEVNEKNSLNNVKVTYDKAQPTKGLRFDADEMNFQLTQNEHGPVLHFGYLSWQRADKQEDIENVNTDASEKIKPDQIPNLTFIVDKLYVDADPYGDWNMVITSDNNNLHIDPITSSVVNGKFTGSLDWQDGNNSNVQFTLHTSGTNLKEISQKFSDKSFVTSDKYKVDITLNWLGSPFSLDRESLSGQINFSAEKGRIEAIEDMPVFLKALGIFNLNALTRRLALDFSDINSPGLTYDKLFGNLFIEQGVLNTKEPLTISSPTIEIAIEGKADLVQEILDEQLTASFPLGGSLPIASLLLGATPQIAGLMFLTDKVLGDPLSKVTSIKYKIQGAFQSPEITPIQVEPKSTKK